MATERINAPKDSWERPTDAELRETLEAIREGLADAEAGRLVPAREGINEVRRKHGLPPLRL